MSVGSSYVKFKRKPFILNTFRNNITIHLESKVLTGLRSILHCKIMPLIEVIICIIYRQVEASSISNQKRKNGWTVMPRWRLKIIRVQNTFLHSKVWYFRGVFSPQYVVNASVDVFQRVLVCKMAAFVQLAVFGVVLDLVVYRQTSTVVDTPQIALLWVWSDRVVEDMANKLFVTIGVMLLNKRDLFTFFSGTVALYLKNWNNYTKKLCNHHFYRFHTPPGEQCFS